MNIINVDSLITDRTQADVDWVIELKNKILANGFDSLTSEEQSEYMNGMRGAYNSSVIYRVQSACVFLKAPFTDAGIPLEGYTGYTPFNIGEAPTSEKLAAYLANVASFKKAANLTQEIPETMDRLSFEDANNIEKLLIQADSYICGIMSGWLFSGEFEAGEF